MLLDTEKLLLARGTELYAHKGEYLYRKEQLAEFVFYLKDGSVEILPENGKENHRLQSRCFLGLHEALLNVEHQASVKVNDESILLVFDKQEIEHFMDEHRMARRYFMIKLCDQMDLLQKSYE